MDRFIGTPEYMSPEQAQLVAMMDAFIRGVNHWYEKDEITLEDRDELVEDAEYIKLGITLTTV